MPGIPSGNKQLQMAGLDSLGSNDRGDKVSLSATAQALVDMAAFLISEAQTNLNKNANINTGELETSMSARDIQVDGSAIYIDIDILERYDYINQGVNGVDRSRGSKYSFKNKFVSRGMAASILSWLRKRGRRARTASHYKPISKTERKDLKLRKQVKAADDFKSLAYAVSRNIKSQGIKPTKFWDKAVKATERQFKKEIAAGFRIDIINNLK